jgi:hypothetical protein
MHTPAADRYDHMTYACSGRSGLRLPSIPLGLWHNFGSSAAFDNAREMVHLGRLIVRVNAARSAAAADRARMPPGPGHGRSNHH